MKEKAEKMSHQFLFIFYIFISLNICLSSPSVSYFFPLVPEIYIPLFFR